MIAVKTFKASQATKNILSADLFPPILIKFIYPGLSKQAEGILSDRFVD